MRANLKIKQNFKSKKSQAGVLLLEALIAILIFSFGLLGLVGLQAVATQNSSNAEERAKASMMANDIVSVMWVKNSLNPTADVTAWKLQVADIAKSGLPNATGDVAVLGKVATVTVTWRAPSKTDSNRYITNVSMP
jgi:type IV pilus assembly protein PilV